MPRSKKRLAVALVHNAASGSTPDTPEDRGSMADLRLLMRQIARGLRATGCRVRILPFEYDLFQFQRRLRRLDPDVVFNQYEDVVHGAVYEMRVAAMVQMMGYPLTGSPTLPLGLCRYKYMVASLLHGADVAVPPQTRLIERVSHIDRHKWRFPLFVQPAQEHAGVGVDRASVVWSKRALREKVRLVIQDYGQPALVQAFFSGREFNVGVIGGRRMRVLPIAEVDYSQLPENIPPIMSYAAKFIETSVEYRKTSVLCPAQVDDKLGAAIRDTALRAFRAVGGWGYGRVDMRLDDDGRPCVLEVNCNPSIEPGVALARAAERAGISYPKLLRIIINAALEGPPHDVTLPMMGTRGRE